MFFIFGWGQRKVQDHGPLPPRPCPRCRNREPWRLQTVSEWLTVFFIPLIPLRRHHVAVCPVCGYAQALTAAALEEARRLGHLS